MLQVVTPPPAPEALPPWVFNSGPSPVVFLIPIVAIIVTGIVLYPLLRAWARRLEGRSAGSAELDELRARVASLEEQAMRVPELEERLDFAERLLANARESGRLKGG